MVLLAPVAAAEEPRGHSGYVLPGVAYDTDEGFGFGVRGELARLDDALDPYRWGVVAHFYTSTAGFHHHRLYVDALGLGPRKNLRLTTRLAWRQWLNDGYYGIGNDTARERAYVGDFEPEDPDRRRYRYTLIQPFLQATLRIDLRDSPVQLFAALNPKYSIIQTYEGSLLADQRPWGTEGGAAIQVSVGGIYDTRTPEVAPTSGVLMEASTRYALPIAGSAGDFGGALLSLSVFTRLGGPVVFAGRVMAEQLFGRVPFYEMVHWGGSTPIAGFGGATTLRGVSFGRWRDTGKAVANLELRMLLIEHGMKKVTLGWELTPFVDIGTVWSPSGGSWPPHPTAGLGGRVIWDHTFVARVDVGVGVDAVKEDNGAISQEPSLGVYLAFGHPF